MLLALRLATIKETAAAAVVVGAMTEVDAEPKLDVVPSLLLVGEDDVDVANKPTAASSSPSTSLVTSVGIGLFSWWCVICCPSSGVMLLICFLFSSIGKQIIIIFGSEHAPGKIVNPIISFFCSDSLSRVLCGSRPTNDNKIVIDVMSLHQLHPAPVEQE